MLNIHNPFLLHTSLVAHRLSISNTVIDADMFQKRTAIIFMVFLINGEYDNYLLNFYSRFNGFLSIV